MSKKRRSGRNVMGLDTLEEQARALNMANHAYTSAMEALRDGEILKFVYWSGYIASSRDLAEDEHASGLVKNLQAMIHDLRNQSGIDLSS